MTLPKNVMSHLVDRAQQQYDSACLVVARTQKAIDTAVRTKRTLDQFVQERASSRRDQRDVPVSIESLKIDSVFSGKLGKAVDSQANSLHELELARDANNATLVSAHRHLDVMKNLQDQAHKLSEQVRQLAEQRENDEHAARLIYTNHDAKYGKQEEI